MCFGSNHIGVSRTTVANSKLLVPFLSLFVQPNIEPQSYLPISKPLRIATVTVVSRLPNMGLDLFMSPSKLLGHYPQYG